MDGIDLEVIKIILIYALESEEMASLQLEKNVKMTIFLQVLMDEVLLAQWSQAGLELTILQ